MGFILSKFKKKKPATKDLLESIDKELRDIQRFQVDTELRQKRIIGRIVIFSAGAYLIAAAAFYFLAPRGIKWQEQLKNISPFIVFPPLMWCMKYFVAWFYERKIIKKKERYTELKKQKERILEDVMDNETFKVGKEILEKYAPSQLMPKHMAEQYSALATMSPLSQTPQQMQRQPQRSSMGASPGYSRGTPVTSRASFDEGLRRRQIMSSSASSLSTPINRSQQQGQAGRPAYGQFGPRQFSRQPANNAFYRPQLAITSGSPTPNSPQTVRFTPSYMMPLPPSNPIVHDKSSGWMDKLVDYFIGDGPNNRYALICRYCATNNGLATAENFPYVGFRCVYCHQYSPPKQVRPAAPKLPTNNVGQVIIEELESTIKSPSQVSMTSEDEGDKSGIETAGVATEPESESESDTRPEKSKPEEEEGATENQVAEENPDNDQQEHHNVEEPSNADEQEKGSVSVESMEVDNEEKIEAKQQSEEVIETVSTD